LSDLFSSHQHPPKLTLWQLAAILGTSLGIPGMLVAGQLAQKVGPGQAIIAVLLGNFALWWVGFGMFSMSHHKSHAIENIKMYMGTCNKLDIS
jgi:hypothetical protein